MTYCDHIPFAWFKFILDAVLKFFAIWFCLVCEYETCAHKISCIADAFTRAEPIEVRLFFFNVHTSNRIDTKPSREGKTILVRPVTDWWQ